MDEKLYEQLNDYLDGDLNDADRAALEARLEHDPELKREFDALRELVQAAHALPKTVQPERDLWAGIEKCIAEEADTGGVIRFGGAQRRAAAGSLWPWALRPRP
jgi:anti-sigma factor RsiW